MEVIDDPWSVKVQMWWPTSVPPLVLATVQEKGREARQYGVTDLQADSRWWDPPKLTRKEPRTQRHEEGVVGVEGGYLQTGWSSGLSAESSTLRTQWPQDRNRPNFEETLSSELTALNEEKGEETQENDFGPKVRIVEFLQNAQRN